MNEAEAIKHLKLHSAFNGKLDRGRCIRIPEESFTETKEAIEIVLNLLEKKDKEIENLKIELEKKNKRLNKQFKLLQKKDKEIEKLYLEETNE